MNEIELRVTVDEVNLILEALGNQPFATVYELVAKIQQQAQSQLDPGPGGQPLLPSDQEPDGD